MGGWRGAPWVHLYTTTHPRPDGPLPSIFSLHSTMPSGAW